MKFIELDNGSKFYYHDSDDPVVANLKQGNFFGWNNWLMLRSLINNFNKKGVVVDVGAHIGTFAIESLYTDRDFILIEADEKNNECLRRTFGDRDNVKIVNTIINNKKGKANFSDRRGPFGWIVEDENGPYTTSTLDAVLKDIEVAAIKLDIEGNEINALSGATKILKQKPAMIIEVNGYCLMQQGKNSNDLLRKIHSVEYDSFVLLNGNIFKINPSQFFPFCVMDVIAIHKSESSRFNGANLSKAMCESIYAQIKTQFNEDCQEYFKYIGVE